MGEKWLPQKLSFKCSPPPCPNLRAAVKELIIAASFTMMAFFYYIHLYFNLCFSTWSSALEFLLAAFNQVAILSLTIHQP